MGWKELAVSDQRFVLVHQIITGGRAVSGVAREFGVSRKTAYKWIKRHREDPQAKLEDRSRRPHRSPCKSSVAIEAAVLEVHDHHRWGARKIHRVLADRGEAVPSLRTCASILKRHDRVGKKHPLQEEASIRFERAAPNHLWQLDHKGPLEIGRRRYLPLAVIDDHSRYCLCLQAAADVSMGTTWSILWDLFGKMGLPDAILCDNAFSAPVGLSWFDARLVRLGIHPLHGRPYHPQTQGKIERFNGSMQRELIEFAARRDCVDHFNVDAESWRMTYNTLRPHESLGDVPPITRFAPSRRPRPATLPEVVYPVDAILRKVSQVGDVSYHQTRIVVGRSLARQHVLIEDREHDVAIYYGTHLVRAIPRELLTYKRTNQPV